MSETVQVAFITLLSGAFGALVGATSTLIVAIHNSRSEAKRHLWTERHLCYSSLSNAYHKFLTKIAMEVPLDEDAAAFAEFQCEYAKAVLICEKDTVPLLIAFWKQAGQYGASRQPNGSLNIAYTNAVNAMRAELLPDREKKHQKKRIRRKRKNDTQSQ